jgi:hypothetical protein
MPNLLIPPVNLMIMELTVARDIHFPRPDYQSLLSPTLHKKHGE